MNNKILNVWNGIALKNKGKANAHHYRRDGRLYVVALAGLLVR